MVSVTYTLKRLFRSAPIRKRIYFDAIRGTYVEETIAIKTLKRSATAHVPKSTVAAASKVEEAQRNPKQQEHDAGLQQPNPAGLNGPNHEPRRHQKAPPASRPEMNLPEQEISYQELDFLRLSPTGTLGSMCDVQALREQDRRRQAVRSLPVRSPTEIAAIIARDNAAGIEFQHFSAFANPHCDISNFLPLKSHPPDGPDFGAPGWSQGGLDSDDLWSAECEASEEIKDTGTDKALNDKEAADKAENVSVPGRKPLRRMPAMYFR